MTRTIASRPAGVRHPHWWVWALFTGGAVILTACKGLPENRPLHGRHGHGPARGPQGGDMHGPQGQYAGPPGGPDCAPMEMQGPPPEMFAPPPGPPICPPDEYIYDGGDRNQPVVVVEGHQVHGLHQEDTVVHYDTLDGETKVDPSNRVCIYAPRFAAVRHVTALGLNEQVLGGQGVRQPLGPEQAEEQRPVISRVQSVQLGRNIRSDRMDQLRTRLQGVESGQVVAPFDYTVGLLPYQNLDFIRYGVLINSEKPRLAQTAQAASVWTHDLGVQVMIEGQQAHEAVQDQAAQDVFSVLTRGPSKLRLCKIASTGNAQPGELIEFTLRFDNVGDRTVGNVVLLDNLTTRLEYIPGSAQSSCKTDYLRDENGQIVRNEKGQPTWRQNPIAFSSEWNEGEALVLRWELAEPLKPGQGGILKFQCRVR